MIKAIVGAFVVALLVTFIAVDETKAAQPTANELAVYNHVNALRASYGLPPFRLSCILTDSARAKSVHMDENGYFSHWTPSGAGPEYWKTTFGYPANSPGWGENILWGAESPYQAFTIWANSAPHLENMLGTLYTEVGIGNAGGNHYWGVYTMHFGNANTTTCAGGSEVEIPSEPPDENYDTVTTASLNIRVTPGLSGAKITTLPWGTGVVFLGGESTVDGYVWYNVNALGYEGWVAGKYLFGYETTIPDPTPTTAPPASGGDSEYATTSRLNLRTGPSTSSPVIGTLSADTLVYDYDNDIRYANGYTWRSVQTPLGIGWVAAEFLS